MAPKASPADLENAVRDYAAGEGCEAVAARHRIGYGRLRSVLIDRGLWRTPEQAEALRARRVGDTILARSGLPAQEIVRRYLAGESVNALAKRFDVSRKAIEYRLSAAGVQRRDSTAANRLLAEGRTAAANAAIMRAAQAAVRGTPQTLEHRVNNAIARERSEKWLATHVSTEERQLCRWLERRGVSVTPQKAIGPYNVDLAADSVAVEIFGGGWHGYGRHRQRAAHRLDYILNAGWHLMIIWTTPGRWPLTTRAADELMAFSEIASRHPSGRGEHRVIWGDGKPVSVGDDVNDLSAVPARSTRKRRRS